MVADFDGAVAGLPAMLLAAYGVYVASVVSQNMRQRLTRTSRCGVPDNAIQQLALNWPDDGPPVPLGYTLLFAVTHLWLATEVTRAPADPA